LTSSEGSSITPPEALEGRQHPRAASGRVLSQVVTTGLSFETGVHSQGHL